MSRHPFKPNASDDEGYEPFIVAEGWREETEIRFVPESEIAVAVAAAIEETRKQVYAEIRQLAITAVERSVKAGFDATALIRFAADLIGDGTDG